MADLTALYEQFSVSDSSEMITIPSSNRRKKYVPKVHHPRNAAIVHADNLVTEQSGRYLTLELQLLSL